MVSPAFAATSNVTTISKTNVTVNDGFATAIINVEITKKNNLYSISKTTVNPVKINKTSLMFIKNYKCLSSTIASGGSSATVKYSYDTWYWSYSPSDNPFTDTSANYEDTTTVQEKITINSGTGKLTFVASQSHKF